MKITELIENLNKQLDIHGDIPVYIPDILEIPDEVSDESHFDLLHIVDVDTINNKLQLQLY